MIVREINGGKKHAFVYHTKVDAVCTLQVGKFEQSKKVGTNSDMSNLSILFVYSWRIHSTYKGNPRHHNSLCSHLGSSDSDLLVSEFLSKEFEAECICRTSCLKDEIS